MIATIKDNGTDTKELTALEKIAINSKFSKLRRITFDHNAITAAIKAQQNKLILNTEKKSQ